MRVVDRETLSVCPIGSIFYKADKNGDATGTPYIKSSAPYFLKSSAWWCGAIPLSPVDACVSTTARFCPEDISTDTFTEDDRFVVLTPLESVSMAINILRHALYGTKERKNNTPLESDKNIIMIIKLLSELVGREDMEDYEG